MKFLIASLAFLNLANCDQDCDSDHKMVICHFPPGNLNNPQTLCIDTDAWPAHDEEHEHDYVGACTVVPTKSPTVRPGENCDNRRRLSDGNPCCGEHDRRLDNEESCCDDGRRRLTDGTPCCDEHDRRLYNGESCCDDDGRRLDDNNYSCTSKPTAKPTVNPTSNPTVNPTSNPTVNPTSNPTANPTSNPTVNPTSNPNNSPTAKPTVNPTSNPNNSPTAKPTVNPTAKPTVNPTAKPTVNPTAKPTSTSNPTVNPTSNPNNSPTAKPTSTDSPTSKPTAKPTSTDSPTAKPTAKPTSTDSPTAKPTAKPTSKPITKTPTAQPTFTQKLPKTKNPTKKPTTAKPTTKKTKNPTTFCIKPYNLIFIVDQTGSITEQKYKNLVPVLTSLLSGLDIKKGGVNAAMVSMGYGDANVAVDLRSVLSSNKQGFINFVKNSPFKGGYTNLPSAANRAMDIMASMPSIRKQYRTYVFVFTDGYPEMPELKVAEMRKKTRNAFHQLKNNYPTTYFQGVAVGNKYYAMYANQAILKYISDPQPVLIMNKVKPYNPFIKSLMTPTCSKTSDINPNTAGNIRDPFGELGEY